MHRTDYKFIIRTTVVDMVMVMMVAMMMMMIMTTITIRYRCGGCI